MRFGAELLVVFVVVYRSTAAFLGRVSSVAIRAIEREGEREKQKELEPERHVELGCKEGRSHVGLSLFVLDLLRENSVLLRSLISWAAYRGSSGGIVSRSREATGAA